MVSDTKNLHLNLLYLFPGELDSQKGLKHFKHCRTEERTSSMGVRGVYQLVAITWKHSVLVYLS